MMAAARSCWSDLPPELLGLVLKHLPSLADRVRLRAVCHPWRSNAWLQSLPPPLPLLALLDGTFLSIPDGEIIKLSVPEDACCYGSIDNWLFLVHNDGKCLLMEPFSGDILKLPNLNTGWYLRMRHGYYEFSPDMFNGWYLWMQRGYCEFNPVMCKLSVPSPLESSRFPLVAMMLDESLSIFKASHPETCVGFDRTFAFEVFEADLSSKPCRWRRVDDLGGHALFVSSSFSKSFLAGECSGVQENCIYFMNQRSRVKRVADPLHDSGMYNMKNGAISPLLSETATVPSNHVGRWHPTWLFPTQAM